jgi:uncharacterized membrane protein YphA (DoxX/SURF4 family)
MQAVFIIAARLLIVAPFLGAALLAALDWGAAKEAAASAPFAKAFPFILAAEVLTGVWIVVGAPLHRILAAVLAAVLVTLAVTFQPFWHSFGSEAAAMQGRFLLSLAQAGGFLLVAVMPKVQR